MEDTQEPVGALGTETHARIVVGVDGSAESKVALRWAATLAQRTGALIDAVNVWQQPIVYGWETGLAVVPDWNPESDVDKVVTAVTDEVFGPQRPPGLRIFTLEGSVAQRLIEHSGGAQMLILGNRGRGGFVGLLLGSVSSACAAHATCPVLIVHDGDVPPWPP